MFEKAGKDIQAGRTSYKLLMMEAVSTSETSVNFYEAARRNIQKAITFIFAAVRT
jgi:hypothetical protein